MNTFGDLTLKSIYQRLRECSDSDDQNSTSFLTVDGNSVPVRRLLNLISICRNRLRAAQPDASHCSKYIKAGYLENSELFLAFHLACDLENLLFLPLPAPHINPELKMVEVLNPAEIFSNSTATTDTDSASTADFPERFPYSVISFTSGSSGRPKIVYRRLPADPILNASYQSLQLSSVDSLLITTPLAHIAPYFLALLFLQSGKSLQLARCFEPATFWKTLARSNCDTVFLTPAAACLAAAELPAFGKIPSNLRRIYLSGQKLYSFQYEFLSSRLNPELLWSFYGLSEVGIVSVATPEDLLTNPETAGTPLTNIQIHQQADQRLAYNSPNLFSHYLPDIKPALTADGFYISEDLGFISPDGQLTISGRADRMINRGGVKIDPEAVKAALLARFPDQISPESVKITPISDPVHGQKVQLQLTAAAALQPLISDYISSLPSHQRIDQLVFSDI